MRKTRSLGHRVLALFLCCVMVYGMIPTEAVALEPICGIEEHVHDESCHAVYGENVLKCRAGEYLHKHTDVCYDSGGNLICHYADFYLHKHSAEQGCYDSDGNLVCNLPEYDESLHEDIYYSGGDVTCVYAPRFGHVHDDSCYETRKTLTCGLEQDENAHRHDDSCYDLVLTCGFDEDAGTGGSDGEVSEGPGSVEVPETSGDGEDTGAGSADGGAGDAGESDAGESDAGESDAGEGGAAGEAAQPGSETGAEFDSDDYAPLQHVHDASCYTRTLTCGLEETGHVHDDSCYETVRELTCGKIQDDGDADGGSGNVCRHWQYELHTHDESCFDKDGNVVCGKWELKSHTHDSHCFEREVLNYDSPEPTCGKDEHKHGISCYFKEKTEELQAFLDGYESLKNAIDSGEYDLESDEGKIAVADDAMAVKQIGMTLDKDVLALDSVKEMMAYLDGLIPDGYNLDGGSVLSDVHVVKYDVRISDIPIADLAGGHVEIFLQTWTDAGHIRSSDGTELPISDYQSTNWHDYTTRGDNSKRTGYAFTAEFDDGGYVSNMPSFCMPAGRDVYTDVGRVHVRYVTSSGAIVKCESRAVSFDVVDGAVANKYVWTITSDMSVSSLTEFSAADFGISVAGCSVAPIVSLDFISHKLSGGIPVEINVENMYAPNLEGQAVISGYPVTVSSSGATTLPEIYFPFDDIYYVKVSMSVPDASSGIADDTYYQFVIESRDGKIKSALYYPMLPNGHTVKDEDGKAVTFSQSEGCRFIVRPSPDMMADFSPDVVAKADKILAGMSRQDRLAQMVTVHAPMMASVTKAGYKVGGVLLFQDDCQYNARGDGLELGQRIAGYQSSEAALYSADGQTVVPMWVAVDEEGGVVVRVSKADTYGPDGRPLRSEPYASDRDIYNSFGSLYSVKTNAVEKAEFLRSFGFNVNYSPVLDVSGSGYMWSRGRSFSGDPLAVSEYAWYVISGHKSKNVGSSAKHFPGYGDTANDTHKDGFVHNEATLYMLEHNDFLPFYAAMADGVDMLMVTHTVVDAVDNSRCASMSPDIYALARRMGYKNVIITDDLGMGSLSSVPMAERGIRALQAGADVAMCSQLETVEGVMSATTDQLSDARVEESVRRILCNKIALGLLDDDVEVDPPVPVDEEAEYIDSDGQFGGRGLFEDMWDKAAMFGGTVRLLKDCQVESVQTVTDRDITLDVDGYELYFVGTGTGFNVCNSSGHTFIIRDSSGTVSVSSSELTDFVKQDPKTTATDGMLSGVWDIDYANRIAKWQSVDFDSCKPVEVSLDLSRSGGIRMQNGVALLSSADGSSVKFESGYITSDTTSSLSSWAVRADDGRSMALDVSDGWFFGYHSTNSIISMGQDSRLVFSGGGVVGSNTPHSAINVWGYNSRVSLKNAHVSANIALEGAVRLGCENAKLSMERCDVASNYGGGVVIDKGGLESMHQCIVAFNRSMGDGGGLAVLDTALYVNVSGSLFVYNSAKGNGGAMYIAKGGSISGYEDAALPVRVLNNCADYGGGVCVDRYGVDGGVTVFKYIRLNGNEATTAGGIGVRGHGYLTLFSDVFVEDSKADNFAAMQLDIMQETSTDDNIRFKDFTVRNCSTYEDSDTVYTMNLRNPGTYTVLSGTISLDEGVKMRPFSENTLYVLSSDFNVSTRIPVQAGFTVPLMSPVRLAIAEAGGSFDLSAAVRCFVPDAEHKVWYDAGQNCIMYGDINYNQGSSSTGEGVQIEYFANIEQVDEGASGGVFQIPLIDDSKSDGSGMRSNSDTNAPGCYLPLNIYKNLTSSSTNSEILNAFNGVYTFKPAFLKRNDDKTFSLMTHFRLTEMYKPLYFEVQADSNVLLSGTGINRFSHASDGFDVSEIWVVPDRSIFDDLTDVNAYYDASNFQVYLYHDGLYLTGDSAVAEGDPENAIYVSNDSLVRFVANSETSSVPMHAVFYDYDLSNDPTVNGSGINSRSNYSHNGSDASKEETFYAFGNGNRDTDLHLNTFRGFGNSDTLSRFNMANVGTGGRSFYVCAFGMVKGLDDDGHIIWHDDISAPLLFNEPGAENMKGRTVFADSSLVFSQCGNAFTLQHVSGPDGGPSVSRDLTTFINPSIYDGVQHSKVIYTNNFWPMDSVADYPGRDKFTGIKDSDGKYPYGPESDDGVPHDSYFGMHFEVEFDLYDDYVGPMQYYFFGDDDMWVFLDGKLILDIGGVHSSAGQYVDLSKYLRPETDVSGAVETVSDSAVARQASDHQPHKLTVYYTERGASGSTCWMRFQLPTPLRVTTDTPDDVVTHGNLSIEKQVDGHDGLDVTFPVKLLLRNGDGFFAQELSGEFDYVNSDGSVSGKVKSGDVLNLTPGDVITVRQLPVGTVASVAEDLSGFEHPEFWTLVDDESTVKLAVRFGDDNHLVLKNRYNDKSELRITKRVVDGENNQTDCNDSFSFVGTFRVDGMPLSEPLTGFVCPVGVDPDTSAVWTTIQIRSGKSFSVPANSTVYIKSAPANLEYDIQELPGEAARLGYALVGNPENPSGTISVGNVQEAVFVNALIQDMPELPSAGGIGLRGFMISGSALLCLVFLEFNARKRRTRAAV